MSNRIKAFPEEKNIPVSLVKVLLSYAGDNKIPFGEMAKAFDKSWETDPEARIDIATYDKLFGELASSSKDRYFGLKFGRQTRFSQLSIIGYLIMSAENILEAMRLFQSYQNRIGLGVNIHMQIEEQEVIFIGVTSDFILNQQQRIESSMARMVSIFQQAVGKNIWPTSVFFAHEFDEHDQKLTEFFKVSPRKGLLNKLIFRKSDLLEPIVSSDRDLNEKIVHRLSAVAAAPVTIVSKKVFLCLQELMMKKQSMSLKSVAQHLGSSVRNLQLQLASEGTTFRKIQIHFMTEVSDKLLKENCSITEISFVLGFAEVAVFQRAYKRWTGRSPGKARKQ